MKELFNRIANALDNIFFLPPRLELDDAQKSYLDQNGYKTTRASMPIIMSPYSLGAPMVDYDYISRKDGTEMSNQEYKDLVKKLDAISIKPQNPEHNL